MPAGGWLDRAFGGAGELAPADRRPAGRAHNVANALAAAALARAARRGADAVRAGLAGLRPRAAPQRAVADVAGSATSTTARPPTRTRRWPRCAAYPRRSSGSPAVSSRASTSTTLVASVADRLAGAVLLGVDRAEIAAALARHAPAVPVSSTCRPGPMMGPWPRSCGPRPALARPGTRCCSRPRRPRRTCSAATPGRARPTPFARWPRPGAAVTATVPRRRRDAPRAGRPTPHRPGLPRTRARSPARLVPPACWPAPACCWCIGLVMVLLGHQRRVVRARPATRSSVVTGQVGLGRARGPLVLPAAAGADLPRGARATAARRPRARRAGLVLLAAVLVDPASGSAARRPSCGCTSARCRCSRPSSPSSRWRCGAPTCWCARAAVGRLGSSGAPLFPVAALLSAWSATTTWAP